MVAEPSPYGRHAVCGADLWQRTSGGQVSLRCLRCGREVPASEVMAARVAVPPERPPACPRHDTAWGARRGCPDCDALAAIMVDSQADPKREAMLARKRERARQRWAAMTPEERGRKRDQDRDRGRRVLTPEQLERRRERARQQYAALTPERLEQARAAARERGQRQRMAETPEAREARLARRRAAVLPPERLERQRAADRKRSRERAPQTWAQRMASESPEERADRRARRNAAARQRYAAETPEQRERRLENQRRSDSQRAAVRKAAVRAAVFGHYGTACACCGTTDDLSIDHVAGDGGEHRLQLFGRRDAGQTDRMYRWLIVHDFPPGYQTLCKPCNSRKGKGARCDCQDAGAKPLVRRSKKDDAGKVTP